MLHGGERLLGRHRVEVVVEGRVEREGVGGRPGKGLPRLGPQDLLGLAQVDGKGTYFRWFRVRTFPVTRPFGPRGGERGKAKSGPAEWRFARVLGRETRAAEPNRAQPDLM